MGGDCFQMSRFFINTANVDLLSNTIIITGDDVNHIKNVLRMACGDIVMLSDGNGTDYTASLMEFKKERITAAIIESRPNCTEPPVDITLFQGIPKSDKMDYIIQKSVELGIKRIVPVITGRTVVRFDNAKDIAGKTERWQRICLEAAKQCNRGIIPAVDEPVKLEKALETRRDYALGIIPYEKETGNSLKKCMDSYNDSDINNGIAVFIGPEGGFTEDEINNAVHSGVKPVTLGPRILRTETAGLAVISILMYKYGDLGK